jgi:hypothetical protein
MKRTFPEETLPVFLLIPFPPPEVFEASVTGGLKALVVVPYRVTLLLLEAADEFLAFLLDFVLGISIFPLQKPQSFLFLSFRFPFRTTSFIFALLSSYRSLKQGCPAIIHFPTRIPERESRIPKARNSQRTTTITTTMFRIFFILASIGR